MSAKHTLLTLLATGALLPQAMAQVGIDNADPEQTLDVGGKVKIADDATAPTDGTMRYNSTDADFEGYAGGEWKSLTEDASDQAPSDPRPVLFKSSFMTQSFLFPDPFTAAYDLAAADPYANQTAWLRGIPAGKTLVIDQVCVRRTSGPADVEYVAGLRPVKTVGNTTENFNPQLVVRGAPGEVSQCVRAGRVPLMTIVDGGTIHVGNFSSDPVIELSATAYGFLVDDISDYFRL